MEIDLYLNKKEKISRSFNKIMNKTVIWYPRSKEDAILQFEKLGIPAASQKFINVGAGGITVQSKAEQVAAAFRVLDKRLRYLNNNMAVEAYSYYINNADLFFSDITDDEIFKELYFTVETIQKNKEEFKKIREDYFNKMYDLWS